MASHRKYTPPPAPVPEVKIDGTATAPDLALSVDIPDDAAHEYQKEIATADEVTVRLRKQLDDIKKSEEYHAREQHENAKPTNYADGDQVDDAEFAADQPVPKPVDWRGGDVHYERVPLAKFVWQPDGYSRVG